MMTRLMLFAGLVALAAALFASGPSATAKSSYLKPYYTFKGNGFEIFTSRLWRAEGAGPAKELEKRDPGSTTSKDRSFRVWTPTCKPGQKVTFTRKIDLLGRPSSISASLDIGLAVANYEIFFNNTRVARNTTSLERADLRALRPGENDIDIVVKLQRTSTACTNFQEPPRRGIWFRLTGYFAADLRVGQPPKQSIYIDAKDGARQPFVILLQAKGTTVIPAGTFEVRIGGPGWCIERKPDNSCERYQFALITLAALSEGDIKCVNDEQYLQTSKCTFEDLEPGNPMKVAAGVRFTPDPASPDWVQESKTVSWHGRIENGGPGDSNNANNDNSMTLYFCRYGANDDSCKPKPAS
jgi:hypothetical protein